MAEFGRTLKEDTGSWHEHLFGVIYKEDIVTTVAGSGFVDQLTFDQDEFLRQPQEVFSFSDKIITGVDFNLKDEFSFSDQIAHTAWHDRFTQEGYTLFQEGITATINPIVEKITKQPQDAFTFSDNIVAFRAVTITTTVSGGTFADGTQTTDIFTR